MQIASDIYFQISDSKVEYLRCIGKLFTQWLKYYGYVSVSVCSPRFQCNWYLEMEYAVANARMLARCCTLHFDVYNQNGNLFDYETTLRLECIKWQLPLFLLVNVLNSIYLMVWFMQNFLTWNCIRIYRMLFIIYFGIEMCTGWEYFVDFYSIAVDFSVSAIYLN